MHSAGYTRLIRYTKLNPILDCHGTKLRDSLELLWEFYEALKRYKEKTDKKRKEALERKFEELFSTETGYEELDKRIEVTRGKRDRLLLVLKYTQIPLHNNPAEIALRELVIKRKIRHCRKIIYRNFLPSVGASLGNIE
jgi:hypothetical protein